MSVDEIQAEIERIEAERAAKRATALESVKRAEAERKLADLKALSAAEDELGVGKFAHVETPMGVVIVKRPNHMHFRKFIGSKDIGPDEAERLVHTCLVHPNKAVFAQIAEEYPAIPMQLASKCVELASGKQADLLGK